MNELPVDLLTRSKTQGPEPKVVFRNLEPSEFARAAVRERVEGVAEKFPDLQGHRIHITLSMDNSPLQPGPDQFTVKLRIQGAKYRDIILEKSADTLYAALADLSDHALERLNRYGDRARMIRLRRSRRPAGNL